MGDGRRAGGRAPEGRVGYGAAGAVKGGVGVGGLRRTAEAGGCEGFSKIGAFPMSKFDLR